VNDQSMRPDSVVQLDPCVRCVCVCCVRGEGGGGVAAATILCQN
jgi:hypothetical protein